MHNRYHIGLFVVEKGKDLDPEKFWERLALKEAGHHGLHKSAYRLCGGG